MFVKYSKECENCGYYQGNIIFCDNPCLQCPHYLTPIHIEEPSDKKKDKNKKKIKFPWIK